MSELFKQSPVYIGIAILIPVLFVLLIAALKNLMGRSLKKEESSLPSWGYRLIYTDQKASLRQEGVVYSRMLKNKEYDLQGKPDFIFRSQLRGKLIPVEVKSGEIKGSRYPHEGDLLQLAAYFFLIKEEYGKWPPYGYLMYRDYMFRVPNHRSLRKQVIYTLKRMRRMLETGEEEVAPDYPKCRFCICRHTVCEFNEDK